MADPDWLSGAHILWRGLPLVDAGYRSQTAVNQVCDTVGVVGNIAVWSKQIKVLCVTGAKTDLEFIFSAPVCGGQRTLELYSVVLLGVRGS